MRPNSHQIIAFAHAVREGSFSAAAVKLQVSQSAVSQHISKLENIIGSKLFLRDREGFTLTKTGSEFFDLADRYLTLDRLLEEKLTRYSQLGEGHLTIIGNAPLPALGYISRFNRAHPNVEINFTLYDWTTSAALLRNRKVDIAFITEPPISDEWVYQKVATCRYVLYVPQTHRFAKYKSISLHELKAEALLLPEKGSLTEKEVRAVLKRENIQIKRIIKTTTFPVMKEAILHDVGLGIFLDNSTTSDDTLSVIPIREMTKDYDISIVIPKDKYDLRLIQSFVFDAMPS
ncbi:LysR family transcriptional regulator [Kiloniella majae]|uniref:LysR family transcriptional regulator n=1 Tax=Kiloniella majae TaxID=1938558 RepID=UPI000A2788EE|nr:LysR family transcriptional regulator [Kiloniella majae]